MRMVRWMCGVKLKDRLPSKELRERLGVDDLALVLQQNRLRWYGHVLRKDDWVKKCMEYEVRVQDQEDPGSSSICWSLGIPLGPFLCQPFFGLRHFPHFLIK